MKDTPWSNRVEKLEHEWRVWGHKYFRKFITDTITKLYYGKTVLDVGCGAGILYSQLPPHIQEKYTGIDFTPEFIDLCKTYYPDGDWRVGNIFNLPFKDKSYTLVNTTNVLQHIHKGKRNLNDWIDGARELIRVSSKYIINCARIHDKPTIIVPIKPLTVVHRYFNPQDLLRFYSNYGQVSWYKVKDSRGKPILGVFIIELP